MILRDSVDVHLGGHPTNRFRRRTWTSASLRDHLAWTGRDQSLRRQNWPPRRSAHLLRQRSLPSSQGSERTW